MISAQTSMLQCRTATLKSNFDVVRNTQPATSSKKKVNKVVAFFLQRGLELAHHALIRWCITRFFVCSPAE
jgi:hypothetical protein